MRFRAAAVSRRALFRLTIRRNSTSSLSEADAFCRIFTRKHFRLTATTSHSNFQVRRSIGLIIAFCILLAACSESGSKKQSTVFAPEKASFVDVTDEVGLDFQHGAFRWDVSGDAVAMMGGGLCWLDFDQDGWLDLYVVNSYAVAEAGRWQTESELPRSKLYRNDKGHFEDVSDGSGANLQIRGNGCVAADLNLDGWTDLYITTSRVNALLWNNGDGTFTEDAETAGVDTYGWQTSAAVGDLNKDGWPDLFVAGYVDLNNRIPEATQGFPNTHVGRRDLLYLNQGRDSSGRVSFIEAGIEAGLEDRNFEYGLGAQLTDLNNDGNLDLIVANDTNPNRLYENIPWPGGVAADPEGIGFRFAEVGGYANIDDDNSGMGVAAGDYNSDGLLDLVITNLGQQLHSVYLNRSTEGKLEFVEAAQEMGVPNIGIGWTGWGINWVDVDLDSDLDLIIANGSVPVLDPTSDVQQIQLFMNLSAQGLNGLFQDMTNVAGFNEIGPLLARGSAAADYDNDGDVDIAISTIGGPLKLLRNDLPESQWLTVELEQFYPGAVVTAQLPDGRQLLCEVRAGSSYLSSDDPRCHFGLGSEDKVSVLTVHWPDGQEISRKNVQANAQIKIEKEESFPAAETTDLTDVDEFLFQVMLKNGGAQPLEILPQASPEMIQLGEALFWDRELSGNRDIACATCHHPSAGTGDDLSVSIGTGGTGLASNRLVGIDEVLIPRNATEIFNRGAAGWETMFWDNRIAETSGGHFISPAGEKLPYGLDNVVAVQAMFPVTSRDEMRGQFGDLDVHGQPNELAQHSDSALRSIWADIMDRLMAIPEYLELFTAAFPDVQPERLRFQHAANAIAAYEMSTFTFADSPWDHFLSGDDNALSPEALRGARLFYGTAGCSGCHNGSLLTDQKHHNIGIPQIGPGKGDEAPDDFGRGRESGLAKDMYAFRTPPLRNVALTGPWMHNGAYTTLEGAVQHHLDPLSAFENYDSTQLAPIFRDTVQDSESQLLNIDPLLAAPIELTNQEFNDLMAFLIELTSSGLDSPCELIPDSVPSGLPIDINAACLEPSG